MPSARAATFKQGGGMLRNQDGTIVGVRFVDGDELFKSKGKPGQKRKTSDFHGLFGVLTVQADGVEEPIERSLLVGSVDDFGVTDDGMGLTGDVAIPSNLPWGTFYASLVTPGDGNAGFDESLLDDSDPDIAHYGGILGARARFDWQTNEAVTKKYGQRASAKDPKKKYDREDLIVKTYYGQVDLEALTKKSGQRVAGKALTTAKVATNGSGKALAGKTKAKPEPEAVDITVFASEQVIAALEAQKNHTLTKRQLGVRLLQQLNDNAYDDIRGDVREWALDNENLEGIPGVTYSVEEEKLALA